MKRFVPPLLALVLALSLTACGGKTPKAQESLLTRAAELDADRILLTVDGRKVPAGQYLYWLAATCDHITDYYASAELPLNWGESLSGETLETYAKGQALRDTVLYATVENWAETYGCAMTEADQAHMAQEWDAKAAEYGGETAYLAALADMGLDRAGAEALASHFYLYTQLYTLYRTAGSPLAPAPDEVEQFAAEGGYLTASAIRIPLGEDPAAARAQAAKAFAALNESADPAAAFATLAETYSADPPSTLTAPGEELPLPPDCRQALSALAESQWSGIVETQDAAYLLLRRPLDSEGVSADHFDALLQAAADSAQVELSAAYGRLTAQSFSANLAKARSAGT